MNRSRGQIENRGPKKWRIRVFLGRDGEGKRMYRSELIHGTKTEAKEALSKLLVDKKDGKISARTNWTVATWTRHWVEAKEGIAQSTRRNYRYALEKYINPILGGTKLDSISREVVERLIQELKAREYSPATISQARVVFTMALGEAVLRGLLPRNPAEGVKTPKIQRKEMRTMTRQEVGLFLETAWQGVEDHPNSLGATWPALWTLLLTTGLRPGEALALRWSDLRDGTLSIQRVLRQVSPKQWVIVEGTKTNSSRRSVALPQTTVDVLQAHRTSQAQRILKKGPAYDRDGDLIFGGRDGQSLSPSYVPKKWKDSLKAAGLDPKLRLYDTRHTHATHLLANGANPKVVMDRLGHANIKTTLEVYSHVTPEVRKETAQEVEKMLFG